MALITDADLADRVGEIVQDLFRRQLEQFVEQLHAEDISESEMVERCEAASRAAGQLVIEVRHKFAASLAAMSAEARTRPSSLPRWPAPIALLPRSRCGAE